MRTGEHVSNTGRRAPDGRSQGGQQRAFSLIEIMIVMGLLSVMVIGLMAMFNQTQRAFRLGMTQTDILEAGRMATDLLLREIEQMTPSGLNSTNLNSANFYAAVVNSTAPTPQYPNAVPAAYTPLIQSLPGVVMQQRMNILEDLFFITRQNQTWTGIGYFVRSNGACAGQWEPVGTLYRFEASASSRQFQNPASIQQSFYYAFRNSTNNVSKVVDGVVHFRVRAYDNRGNWINLDNFNVVPNVRTNFTAWSFPTTPTPGDANYFFFSNAVPAFVEVELGLLEPQTLTRYRAIPVAAAQAAFLQEQAAHVHLFRQRVSVRNVDPTAYQ